MKLSGQPHAQANLPPGKEPRCLLYRRLSGPQRRSGRYRDEKNLDPDGNRTPAVQPSLYRLSYPDCLEWYVTTLCSTPTSSSCLYFKCFFFDMIFVTFYNRDFNMIHKSCIPPPDTLRSQELSRLDLGGGGPFSLHPSLPKTGTLPVETGWTKCGYSD
jgi:hypothetical protein